MKFSNMSYRYRVPLSLVATVLFTSSVIGAVIVWHTYQNVRDELIENGARHGFALAAALQPALHHDDVWLAYSILRGVRGVIDKRMATYVMLDSKRDIFASNAPGKFPLATPLRQVDSALEDAVVALSGIEENIAADLGTLEEQLLLVTPIYLNGEVVGELLTIYPRHVLWPRFSSIIEQGGVSVLLILIIIIPVGWYSGSRLVQPLMNLAACMVRVRNEDPENIKCTVMTGDNEIGNLNQRFQELLSGLKEKAELEQQVVANERLAAVGHLAAGVAHEINNPLGGMLMAIDTLHQRGVYESHTEHTLTLLERGLRQIQDTVSALLLESRLESHPVTVQDINDTYTLVMAQESENGVMIEWDNQLTQSISLPSTLVRQIIINLLLNAVQSAPKWGRVSALFKIKQGYLQITISNDGESIEKETLEHLFEPYFSTRGEGSGLGLWVTYQIVQQLDGEISVTSDMNITIFTVMLPLRETEKKHAA